ncbi:MAG: cyclase family protein [Blastocatellia bacterium]
MPGYPTHIDAPRHFAQGHETVDQIPLNQLMGPAVVVDVVSKCVQNPDYQVAPQDFEDWEKQHGAIPEHTIVLMKTGFDKRWPDRKTYLGTDEHGPQAIAKTSLSWAES